MLAEFTSCDVSHLEGENLEIRRNKLQNSRTSSDLEPKKIFEKKKAAGKYTNVPCTSTPGFPSLRQSRVLQLIPISITAI